MRKSRWWVACLSALVMLAAMAAPAGAVPPGGGGGGGTGGGGTGGGGAGPADCLGDATPSVSLSRSTITFGQSLVVSWDAGLPAGCAGRPSMIGPGFTGTVAESGSLAVTPTAVGVFSWRLHLALAGFSSDSGAARVTVNPVDPPVATPPPGAVAITQGDQAERFVDNVKIPGTVVWIAGNVDLNLSGKHSIQIAPGVQILGDRESVPRGPRIFTEQFAGTLLQIGTPDSAPADNVRISGIRFDGGEPADPCQSEDGAPETVAVQIISSQGVEIDHNEFHGWSGSAVWVADGDRAATPLDRLTKNNPGAVWVHDNAIHDNQHPTICDATGTSGNGAGYGVAVAGGAYALIERNVFDKNRHAIAGTGEPGTGYFAYRNLFLHPGIDRVTGSVVHYNFQVDMHGMGCPDTHNCGPAGEYMDVAYNTFVYDGGAAGITLRGTPSDPQGMSVEHNVFAHSRDDAWRQNEIGLHDNGGNAFSVSPDTYRGGTCDFDGDGTPDAFAATGVTWWYTSSALGGRYAYLNQAPKPGNDLILADVNHDGRCDVTAGGRVLFTPGPNVRTPAPNTALVPDVVGMLAPQARAVIAAAGFGADVFYLPFGGDCNRPDEIYSQDPQPGQRTLGEGVVHVLTSSGCQR